jgi:hypothetical protein
VQTESIRRKQPSGAQNAKRRALLGQPRYSPAETTARKSKQRVRDLLALAERRALVDRIKVERGCADCGFNAHPHALEFDHLPGTRKIDTVARLATTRPRSPIDGLLAEIAKCEVVCANCHAIRTAGRR